jgi:hypothetical protein
MRRTFAALLAVSALLVPLAGCDLLSGFLGLGNAVEGTVTFSSSAQTALGPLRVRLLSTVEPGHTGTVVAEQASPYLYWQETASFRFTGVPDGSYHVLAFIDLDDDGAWDPAEPVGGWPNDPGAVPALAAIAASRSVSFTVWMNGAPLPTLDVSVVYNPGSSADTAIAGSLRAILRTYFPVAVAGVTGTMPCIRVTLVPQDAIPAAFSPVYSLPGGADPVILTPGVTRYGDEPWCHNVANQGKGIIAMGSAGSWFLETATVNWPGWAYPGQKPDELRYMNTWTSSASRVVVRNPGSIWGTPLASAAIPLTDGAEVTFASSALTTTEAYKLGGTPPAGGEWYAGRVGDPEHFSAGRQGRFVLFGFEDVPDRADTAPVLLVNLVKYLADTY